MRLLIVVSALSILLLRPLPTHAASPFDNFGNPFQQIIQLINQAVAAIQNSLVGLSSRVSELEKKVASGSIGSTGATGFQGDTGATGLIGATGETGKQGDTGAIGQTGLQGDSGATGPQGITGLIGSTGATGPAGIQGAGNIAFLKVESSRIWVLTFDGKLYDKDLNTPSWGLSTYPPTPLPVDVHNIVQWERGAFLDKDGNVWFTDGLTWFNEGHPPSEITLTPTPTPSPTVAPTTIVFAQDRPASFTTDFFTIPSGFSSMTFHVTTTGTLYGWAPIANVNSFVNEQHRIVCTNNICPDVTIPIISNYYKFGTGTSSGNITATAILNAEIDNSTQTLGYRVNLPFTSGPLQTNPGMKILVTVGQGNPQNITGISLQRNEGGIFVEKHHLSCDGGAVCPLTNLPLLGGEYRVVVEGSGLNALIAALLRPL